jgi:SAM-dependent methyltransferase
MLLCGIPDVRRQLRLAGYASPARRMKALEWDHNAYYQRLLLRQLPRPCGNVLDVGCGAGSFASRLAERAGHVDAIDSSPDMIEQAKRRVPPDVRLILADVRTEPLPAACYDAIVSITALHHMPLPDVLPRLAAALRPGGVLAAVALPRTDLPRELPVELAAGLGHRLLGAAFAVARITASGHWCALEPGRDQMPVAPGSLTTRQVRQQAVALLPGARVRRLLFWRYLLLWKKPGVAVLTTTD